LILPGLFLIKLAVINNIITYIIYLTELAPLIVACLFFRKSNEPLLKVFYFYIFLYSSFVIVTAFLSLVLLDKPKQIFLLRFFPILEFAILCSFYFFETNFRNRKLIFVVCSVLFLCYAIFEYLSNLSAFSFRPLVAECLFFLVIIMISFFEKMKDPSTPLFQLFQFWVSFSLLINFSGNFFLFLYSTFMYRDADFRLQYQIIYGCVTLIKNVSLCIAILVAKKQTFKQKTSNIDIQSFSDLPIPSHPQQSLQQQ
jgi:hypothetical protein